MTESTPAELIMLLDERLRAAASRSLKTELGGNGHAAWSLGFLVSHLAYRYPGLVRQLAHELEVWWDQDGDPPAAVGGPLASQPEDEARPTVVTMGIPDTDPAEG